MGLEIHKFFTLEKLKELTPEIFPKILLIKKVILEVNQNIFLKLTHIPIKDINLYKINKRMNGKLTKNLHLTLKTKSIKFQKILRLIKGNLLKIKQLITIKMVDILDQVLKITIQINIPQMLL